MLSVLSRIAKVVSIITAIATTPVFASVVTEAARLNSGAQSNSLLAEDGTFFICENGSFLIFDRIPVLVCEDGTDLTCEDGTLLLAE